MHVGVRAQVSLGAGERTRDRFFVGVAGLFVLFAFAGFTPTYFYPLATGTARAMSPAVHVHGALFFSWTLFFLLQTTLVARGRVATHRSAGLIGISLATAMVIFGFIVSLRANAARVGSGELQRAYDLGFGNTLALVAFGTMVALAIANRRRPDRHKRLLVFGTCMLLNAPLGRLYRALFDPLMPSPWVVFLTVDSILAAMLLHDLRTLRRPHPVTLVAGSVLLASQTLRSPVAGTEIWRATYDVLLRLVA